MPLSTQGICGGSCFVWAAFSAPLRRQAAVTGAQVDLVLQQAEVLRTHTELRVAAFVGSMAINYCQPEAWRAAIEDNDVLVMTHQILLNILRHAILTVHALPCSLGFALQTPWFWGIPARPQLQAARQQHFMCNKVLCASRDLRPMLSLSCAMVQLEEVNLLIFDEVRVVQKHAQRFSSFPIHESDGLHAGSINASLCVCV